MVLEHLIRRLTRGGALSMVFAGMLLPSMASALTITNVMPVNVTPSSFSIFWQTHEPATPSISVFSDALGTTNLAGQVGIEVFPLHTGNPDLTEPYARRQTRVALQQKTRGFGMMLVRITGCQPDTTYYYRLGATGTNAQQVVYPSSGPLPSARTAVANSFVTDAKQVLIDVPGGYVEGRVVTLSNTNAAYRLAAVVGDGAATNQACFDLSDLFALVGGTNFVMLGAHEFAFELPAENASIQTQRYTFNFTADFTVSDPVQQAFAGDFLTISLGSAVLRAGDSNSIAIGSASGVGLTNIVFDLDLPTNRFSDVTLGDLGAGASGSLTQSSPGHYVLKFPASSAEPVQGVQSNLARLNFRTLSNQPSAIVFVRPQTLTAIRTDGTAIVRQFVNPGKIVVIGEEPLLEAMVTTNDNRALVLYGKPASSYGIQVTTNLVPPHWSDVMQVSLTGLSTILSGVDTNHPTVFYRAYDLTEAVPTLQASVSGGTRNLAIQGKPGFTYELQSATSMSGVVVWNPVLTITLTNSVSIQSISNVPQVFYRLKLK